MKLLKTLSGILNAFGLLFWCLFQFLKTKIAWPEFISKNIEYICFGSIALGYLLIIIFYMQTKNRKEAKRLLIFATLVTVIFVGVYFMTR